MIPSRPEDLLAIAHIVRPHGVRGELSAEVLAPPVLELGALLVGRLYARFPGGEVRAVRGLGVRPHQERLLITLEGIQDMNAAETLRQVDLCLPRAELPPLPEGWYWEADVQACRVIDRTLGEIGQAAGLNLGLAQPRLELRRPDGALALIPWVRAFILEVNLETHQILVDLPGDFPGISASATQA